MLLWRVVDLLRRWRWCLSRNKCNVFKLNSLHGTPVCLSESHSTISDPSTHDWLRSQVIASLRRLTRVIYHGSPWAGGHVIRSAVHAVELHSLLWYHLPRIVNWGLVVAGHLLGFGRATDRLHPLLGVWSHHHRCSILFNYNTFKSNSKLIQLTII